MAEMEVKEVTETQEVRDLSEDVLRKYLNMLDKEDFDSLMTIVSQDDLGNGKKKQTTKLSQIINVIDSVNKVRTEEFRAEAEVYDRELRIENDKEKAIKEQEKEQKKFWVNLVKDVIGTGTTLLIIIGILFQEQEGSVTTKALNYIPRLATRR